KAGNACRRQNIVETGNACYADSCVVEELLAAGDRLAIAGFAIPTAQTQPRLEQVEDVRVEWRARRIIPKWIVHADKKFLQRQRDRSALRSIRMENVPLVVEDLRGEQARLKRNDLRLLFRTGIGVGLRVTTRGV